MPTIEEGIFSLLSTDTGVTAALAQDAAGTVCLYPVAIAENAVLPAAAFSQIGGDREIALDGTPSGPTRARFQFTTAADFPDPGPAITAMNAILLRLHGYRGQTPNGVTIQLARVVMDPIDATVMEARMFTRHCDVEIIYQP